MIDFLQTNVRFKYLLTKINKSTSWQENYLNYTQYLHIFENDIFIIPKTEANEV